jgi:hypothetical protein
VSITILPKPNLIFVVIQDSSCTENVVCNVAQSASLAYMLPVSAQSQNANGPDDVLSKVPVEVNEGTT